MSQTDGQDGGASNRTLVIILSTVLSAVVLVILVVTVYLCRRNRRRHPSRFFRRGVTPIGDDEIATWKVKRHSILTEKGNDRFTKRGSTVPSLRTHKKVASNNTIQYQQSSTRPSLDAILSPTSPRSFIRKQSFDLPQLPPSAVVAVAPNARTGLTDDTVPGDAPYVATPKRHPSKLSKAPPGSAGGPPVSHRPRTSRGSRTNSMRSFGEAYYGSGEASGNNNNNNNTTGSPRMSSDARSPPSFHSHSRVPSLRGTIPSTANVTLSSDKDSEPFSTVLSPPPLHRTEIGRALG
jgi:hypothetical protein